MKRTIQDLIQLAQEYLDKHYQPDKLTNILAFRKCEDRMVEEERDAEEIEMCDMSMSPMELNPDMLESLEPTFSQKLFDLIKKQQISETDCYKNANLDRRLFSKIRSDDDYQPSKNTVFALIFGLRLTLKDANGLLDAAGYSISHSLKMDVLVEFMIKRRIYDMFTVNEILYKYGCPLLGNVAK